MCSLRAYRGLSFRKVIFLPGYDVLANYRNARLWKEAVGQPD